MSNKFERQKQVERVSRKLDISNQLAKELLILAGGDEDLVVHSSKVSANVAECKAVIIDERLRKEERNESKEVQADRQNPR